MDRLPDELLRETLSYNLLIPHAEFLYYHDRFDDDPPAPRPARLLRVSKRWLRTGTPLLYECVRLRTPAHTAAVAQLFRAHPRVAQGVRCLRLEGGLGKDLVHVAKYTTGLRCLYVDLQIKSVHSIAGLEKALPLLKPVELYIREETYRDNKTIIEARTILYSHIRSSAWSSLRTVSLSEKFHRLMPLEEFTQALEKSSIEELACDADDVQHLIADDTMQSFVEPPSLKRVVCRGITEEESMRALLKEKRWPQKTVRKFTFVHSGTKDERRLLWREIIEMPTL
ncbi:hypothetical protein PsYK624_080930 [Phanerochaete sordida]|uniref:Uncharacterized protein n=1 Tax=Phanerochaete sordida TaxID=48140 RepID=A0A9P3GBQ4_9APHY|nr:hypothetical protein PsYK624_080930 [Phanerochaete sordida]